MTFDTDTEAAIQGSFAGANPEWKRQAIEALHLVAAQKAELTSYDVYPKIDADTSDFRAMGAVMRIGAKNGWIAATDKVVSAALPGSHPHLARVWESRIHCAR